MAPSPTFAPLATGMQGAKPSAHATQSTGQPVEQELSRNILGVLLTNQIDIPQDWITWVSTSNRPLPLNILSAIESIKQGFSKDFSFQHATALINHAHQLHTYLEQFLQADDITMSYGFLAKTNMDMAHNIQVAQSLISQVNHIQEEVQRHPFVPPYLAQALVAYQAKIQNIMSVLNHLIEALAPMYSINRSTPNNPLLILQQTWNNIALTLEPNRTLQSPPMRMPMQHQPEIIEPGPLQRGSCDLPTSIRFVPVPPIPSFLLPPPTTKPTRHHFYQNIDPQNALSRLLQQPFHPLIAALLNEKHPSSRSNRMVLQDILNDCLAYARQEDFPATLLLNALNHPQLGELVFKGNLGEGMYPPAAIYAVWQKLYQIGKTQTLQQNEQVILEQFLSGYQTLFYSSLCHTMLIHDVERQEALDALSTLVWQGQPVMFHSGFLGHTTITRATLFHRNDIDHAKISAGSHLRKHYDLIDSHLNCYPPILMPNGDHQIPLTNVLQPMANLSCPTTHPMFQSLLDSALNPHSYLITLSHQHPSEYDIYVLNEQGHPCRHHGKLSELQATLDHPSNELRRQLAGKWAIPNTVKITTHNAGAERANPLQDGKIKTFDRRYLVPLMSCQDVLTELLMLKHDNAQIYTLIQEEFHKAYHIDPIRSLDWIADVSIQHLGNCTLYSQKMALLYHAQHPEEWLGKHQTIDAQQGEALGNKLWTLLIEKAHQALGQAVRFEGDHLLLHAITQYQLSLQPYTDSFRTFLQTAKDYFKQDSDHPPDGVMFWAENLRSGPWSPIHTMEMLTLNRYLKHQEQNHAREGKPFHQDQWMYNPEWIKSFIDNEQIIDIIEDCYQSPQHITPEHIQICRFIAIQLRFNAAFQQSMDYEFYRQALAQITAKNQDAILQLILQNHTLTFQRPPHPQLHHLPTSRGQRRHRLV